MENEWLRVGEEYTRKAMSTPARTQVKEKTAFALVAIAALLMSQETRAMKESK